MVLLIVWEEWAHFDFNFATLKNQDFGKPKSGAPIMILIIKQQLKTVAEMSACSMDKLSALSTMK